MGVTTSGTMNRASAFVIATCFISACANPPSAAPVVARQPPKALAPATSQASVVAAGTASIEVAEEPSAPPDRRCEFLRLENERKAREFGASLKVQPEGDSEQLTARLLGNLSTCLPSREAAWGLGFAWPRPAMPELELIPSRGMNPEAWYEHLMLQIVRVSNDGDFQRACISVGTVGPRDCSLAVSGRALQTDRTAVPVLVFEQPFQIERVVDFDDNGEDELVLRQGFCMYDCFTWFEVWSSSQGHLTAFSPTQTMNIVAIDDFDGDGRVDVATRAGFAQICHEKSASDGSVRDECFGPEKASPALVRKNLGGGRFAPPSVEIETETPGRPDPRGFKF